MRIILLNGPRDAGKDTLAIGYRNSVKNPVLTLPIAYTIKIGALAERNLGPEYVDYFEMNGKDDAYEILRGATPREVYIEYGNRKRAEHGPQFFADAWLLRICEMMPSDDADVIVPDVRFAVEFDAAVRFRGRKHVLLVHVYREGRTWQGDIGSYLYNRNQYSFINSPNVSVDDVGKGLKRLVDKWSDLAGLQPVRYV